MIACTHSASRYTARVSETTDTQIGVWKMKTADTRLLAVFLRPQPCARLQWSGRGEGALAHAGFRFRRYANLAMCPATPIGVGGRVFEYENGGRIMRHIPARPEQTQAIPALIADALRAAALAPSDRDALDVLGAALVRLADLSRVEVAHV
jgi:hypothetical protein